MARGKHGQAAAVRQEVQTRDAEIAELRHRGARLTADYQTLQRRYNDLRRVSAHAAAERERELQSKINAAVYQMAQRVGFADGVKEGTADAQDLAPIAYQNHLVEVHGVSRDEAWKQAVDELRRLSSRANRRIVAKRLNRAAP